MLKTSDAVWQQLARTDPYWAVVSLPQYRLAQMDQDAKNAFFQSGEDFIDYVLNVIQLHFSEAKIETTLDFGCGVGRLTKALLARGINVTATDISRDMLDLCAENAGESRRQLRCVLADDTFQSLQNNSFDLCISTIVFQHIDPRRGLQIYRRLFELVRPGGFMVHFFIFSQTMKSGSVEVGNGIEREIEMNEYDLNQLLAICAELGGSIYADLMRHGPHFGMNLFVRKQ
jgi:SAM-dependent methyltransferase